MLYSTYLGGGGGAVASGIAVDASGAAYVTGVTASSNFPTTSGAFQTTYGGGEFDAFISKFSFGTPALSLAPTSLTFATEPVGTFSSGQLATLKNIGGAPLSIASIGRSGDFYEGNNCGASLSPGAFCMLRVTFTPTSPGTRSGDVTIADNAPGSPHKLPLTGTGSGTGSIVLMLSPASLSFGSVAIGTTSNPQTATLTNTGTVAASFLDPFGFATSGTDWRDFHKDPHCGASLAPGKSCTVTVTFKPTAGGTRTGFLVVRQGAASVQIPLSGTGTS